MAAVDGSSTSAAAAADGPRLDNSTLSILTWNVWFGSLRQSYRYAAIVSHILSLDVDVGCFQEVTAPFVAALTSSRDIVGRYDLSPNHDNIFGYGVLIIAKKNLRVEFAETELPTAMGRSLLVARLTMAPATSVAVGNVHLESLDNEPVRREQLRIARNVLEGRSSTTSDVTAASAAAVLCGDFNFDSTQTYGDWRRGAPGSGAEGRTREEELENRVLTEEMPGWVDAWPHLKGRTDPGITFDGSTNPVCVRDEMERMRYDRIMVRMTTSAPSPEEAATVTHLVPQDIEMVGTRALDDTGIKASDHYGLRIRLAVERR